MKRLIITIITAILLFTAPLYAVQSFNYPRFSAFDGNGDPRAGDKLFFYENGTTTKKDTYSNYALSTANTNPVVLGSDGVADVDIYLDGVYTVVFAPSGESHPPSTTYWTIDNVTGYGVAFKWNRTAIDNSDTPYTMLSTDDLIEVDTTAGDVEIDLVAAATLGAGRHITFTLVEASNQLTLDPNGAETIGGSSTIVLTTTGEAVTLYSDGTNLQFAYSHNASWANNTYWQSVNAAGTGSVDMIKVNDNDEPEVPLLTMDETTAPTTDANQMGVFVQAKDGASELYAVEESDGDEVQLTDQGRTPFPIGWISGLQMSNDTDADADVAIAVGGARDSTDAVNLALSSVLTKRIDATFASGDDAGGMFTGTVGNSTWYHLFLIRLDSDGTIDAGFDTSTSAANIPTGYTEFRWIGSVLTDGTADILPFYHSGDILLWDDPALDIEVTEDATADLRVLSGVPTGAEVEAILNVYIYHATGAIVRISSPNISDESPSISAAPLQELVSCSITGAFLTRNASRLRVLTDTSAQVRTRSNTGSTTLKISTQGYIWDRGKN